MNVAQKARDVMLVPLAEKPTIGDIEDALREAQRDGAKRMVERIHREVREMDSEVGTWIARNVRIEDVLEQERED